MNNLKLNLQKNQAQTQNKLPVLFCRNPEKFIEENFSEAAKRLLNNIIYFWMKYRQVSPAQATLGLHSSITRRHVNRLIGMLEDWGFINTTYRHRKTSIYRVSEFFKNHAITFRLRHLFPALKLPLLIMLSTTMNTGALSKNVSPIKVNLSPSVIVYQGTSSLSIHSQVTKRIVRPLSSQATNGWTEMFKNLVEGKARMNETISPAILSIKSLNLTKKGQIMLMSYADEVIKWADPVMQRRGNKGDNFGYFNKLCVIRCKELGLVPDWQIVSKLLLFHKIPTDASPLKNADINPMEQPPAEMTIQYQNTGNKYPKQDSNKKVQQWQKSQVRNYRIMKIETHDYPHKDPEKLRIARESKEFFEKGMVTGKSLKFAEQLRKDYPVDKKEELITALTGIMFQKPVTTEIENAKKESPALISYGVSRTAVDPSWDNLDIFSQPDDYEEIDLVLDIDMA